MKVFIDPKFECHRSVGEFTGRLLLQYADSELVPFDPRDYATALQKGVDDIKKVFTHRAVQSNVANTSMFFEIFLLCDTKSMCLMISLNFVVYQVTKNSCPCEITSNVSKEDQNA